MKNIAKVCVMHWFVLLVLPWRCSASVSFSSIEVTFLLVLDWPKGLGLCLSFGLILDILVFYVVFLPHDQPK